MIVTLKNALNGREVRSLDLTPAEALEWVRRNAMSGDVIHLEGSAESRELFKGSRALDDIIEGRKRRKDPP